MNATFPNNQCPYCGNHHGGTCPRVKSIEYSPDGTVKKVEFQDTNPPRLVPRPPDRWLMQNDPLR